MSFLYEIIALWCLLHWALYQENLNVHFWIVFLSWWNYSQLRFNWTKYIYIANLSPQAGYGTRSILSNVQLVWNQFSFSWGSCYTKVKDSRLPYYLSIVDGRINRFLLFTLCKIQLSYIYMTIHTHPCPEYIHLRSLNIYKSVGRWHSKRLFSSLHFHFSSHLFNYLLNSMPTHTHTLHTTHTHTHTHIYIYIYRERERDSFCLNLFSDENFGSDSKTFTP